MAVFGNAVVAHDRLLTRFTGIEKWKSVRVEDVQFRFFAALRELMRHRLARLERVLGNEASETMPKSSRSVVQVFVNAMSRTPCLQPLAPSAVAALKSPSGRCCTFFCDEIEVERERRQHLMRSRREHQSLNVLYDAHLKKLADMERQWQALTEKAADTQKLEEVERIMRDVPIVTYNLECYAAAGLLQERQQTKEPFPPAKTFLGEKVLLTLPNSTPTIHREVEVALEKHLFEDSVALMCDSPKVVATLSTIRAKLTQNIVLYRAVRKWESLQQQKRKFLRELARLVDGDDEDVLTTA
jgi:hypothetical protein